MRKTILIFTAIAASLTACKKDGDTTDNMVAFAARYGQTITVPTTDFVAEETEQLVRANDHSQYTSGEVTYKVNGNEVAKINFGHGTEAQALVTKDGSSETVSLKEDDKGDKEDYDKVVIEPLVYSEECGYVISGIIDFMHEGTWVARFDYGDGTCDDLITKYTEDNTAGYVFSMNDYPEFNK
ncbi:MAG: flagellar hook assembly protein FlgD [Bacteroidia bacterium]|jgi:flagellar hook assembly protein FlgD